ncbi:ATP-dependent DNA helicase RecG [candidate division WWE3 bacterium]|nr:ATP-dependent DNA helicase RecG [candidate division WWE3 bacterium]
MQLTSPVSSVPKIGPKFTYLLGKLEIKTVEDLLYHFPFRYDDYSQVKLIKDLIIYEICTVKATLEKIENIFTKTGKKFTKAIISDETGKVSILWFNMLFIKNSLEVGKTYNVSGKINSFNNKLSFISPEMEELNSGKSTSTGRLVPIYPETSGISSKWLRTRINDILHSGLVLEEFLPKEVLNKYNFKVFEDALNTFHFPNSLFDAPHVKKRFAYEEFFLELLRIEQKKFEWEKTLKSTPLDTSQAKIQKSIKDFTNSLPFTLSDSQVQAIKEIEIDLAKTTPMNRLLEGDVGSGKTAVALVASYMTYLCGYKTLYMAPTEILANQHYETFKSFFEPLGVKVELKTSTSKNLNSKGDIIIGTHALLFLEDKMDKIGLIVVDEQHRFGVEQRARLLALGTHEEVPHLLTMTATPIPRTLALTIYGDLAISSLIAPENKKKNIKTWILAENKRNDALKWVVEQDKPTFIVCPLISESEHESLENVKAAEVEYTNLKNGAFKGKAIGLLHGRMTAKEKQKTINAFRDGEIKILVATPVIEVGVDIPDATIIVIESAERYGLASLHQLRGRVGRAGQVGYCLVFASNNSRNSYIRLKNLEKYDNGLELAEVDMRLRGQGDMYGTDQHGFKRFRVADFSDMKLIEDSKADAKKYFAKIDTYPKLKKKLESINNKLIHKS